MQVSYFENMHDVPNDAYTIVIYNADKFGSIENDNSYNPTSIDHYIGGTQTKIRCPPNMLDLSIKRYSETDLIAIYVVGFR